MPDFVRTSAGLKTNGQIIDFLWDVAATLARSSAAAASAGEVEIVEIDKIALFLANESRGHTWIPIAAALHALCDTDSCCNNWQCHRATTTLQCLEVTPTSDTQSPWKELNPIGYYR